MSVSLLKSIRSAIERYHARRSAGDNSTQPGKDYGAAIDILRDYYGDEAVDCALDAIDRSYEQQCERLDYARAEGGAS